MNITASNDTPGSRVDRQPQNVATTAAFAGNDPVTSTHIGMSDVRNSVSPGNSNSLGTVYAMRSPVNAHTIAVDGEALRVGVRKNPRSQFCNEQGGGHKDKR